MATVRWFDEEKYESGSSPWVPLTDMTEEEWAQYPPHVQAQADALPYFKKSRPANRTTAARVSKTPTTTETTTDTERET